MRIESSTSAAKSAGAPADGSGDAAVRMTTIVPSRSRTHKVSIWPGSYCGVEIAADLPASEIGVRPRNPRRSCVVAPGGAVRHVDGGGALECFADVAVDGDVRRGGHVGPALLLDKRSYETVDGVHRPRMIPVSQWQASE